MWRDDVERCRGARDGGETTDVDLCLVTMTIEVHEPGMRHPAVTPALAVDFFRCGDRL